MNWLSPQCCSLARALERGLALDGLGQDAHRRVVHLGFFIALIAMLLRICFWAYTQRYWEDALITCLHSENLVRGLGLSHFRPGEAPLHGFTSPLSVLIPLLGDMMHVGFGVEFLKLLSIPAAALTVLYALALGIHPAVRLPYPLIALVMGYLAVEHHQILWGMAGMETQFSVLILLMSLYYAVAWKPVGLGISLGLCMLVRPDYAFWTLIVGVYGLFRGPRDLPRVVGIALALYLPWIVFTFWYYGSPLPNTVVAKGLGYTPPWAMIGPITFGNLKRHVWMTLSEQLHIMLAPTFCGYGTGPQLLLTQGPESPLANMMFFFAVVGSLAVLLRRQWVLFPLLGFVVVYSLYYVFLVPYLFGWYKVPYLALLLLLSVRGLQECARLLPSPRLRAFGLGLFAVGYVGLFAAVLPATFTTERQIQQDVENPVRKAAALFLRDRLQPGDTIGSESLGYLAYYSGGNVYDWPGLASRTVTAWSREHPEERSLEGMLKALRPEYLYLRDIEVTQWFRDRDWLRADYHPIAVFQADPEKTRQMRWVYRSIDLRYRVYQKNHAGDTAPYDESLWP